jgi:3-deoxy-D-manno-octulosonate 8-phosphate phosphatase (KDO 8-P phosphatase)
MSERKSYESAIKVKMLLLDVDGVMTDGGIIIDDKGQELKVFHVRDGHGIKLLLRNGINVGIITGRTSAVVKKRAEELGIKDVYQGCHDKVMAYEKIKESHKLKDEEIGFIGDDIVDIPLLKRVGFPVAVADATEETKAVAIYVTETRGGRGAVREVAEFILKAKGLWKRVIDEYMEA